MKSLSMRRAILWVKMVMFARPQPKSTSGWWYCSSVSSPTRFTKSSASWKFAKRNSPSGGARRLPPLRAAGAEAPRVVPPRAAARRPCTVRASCLRGRTLAGQGEVLLVEVHRVADRVDGLLGTLEVTHVHLFALQHLVVLEEALQLVHPVRGKLFVVLEIPVLRVVEVDTNDLLVVLALVHHVHHPYRAHPHDTQGLDGLLHHHEQVEGVVVVAQGARDKAVVGGVDHGGVQNAVYLQEPRVLIQLVLDLRAFGDLDQGVELLGGLFSCGDVVPGMSHLKNSSRGRCRPRASEIGERLGDARRAAAIIHEPFSALLWRPHRRRAR